MEASAEGKERKGHVQHEQRVSVVAPFLSFSFLGCLWTAFIGEKWVPSSFFSVPIFQSVGPLYQRGRRSRLGIDMRVTPLSTGPLSLIRWGSHPVRANAPFHHGNTDGPHQSVWVTTQRPTTAFLYLQSVKSVIQSSLSLLEPGQAQGRCICFDSPCSSLSPTYAHADMYSKTCDHWLALSTSSPTPTPTGKGEGGGEAAA